MKVNKENIFVIIITLLVVAGSVRERISDIRYADNAPETGTIVGKKIILGKDMDIQGLSSGSTIATGGSIMYFFANDSCAIKYDFKSKIKLVNFDSSCISVTVQDSTYYISFENEQPLPAQFATEIAPIPIAALKLFAQSVTNPE